MDVKKAIEWIKKVTWTKYTDHSPEIFSQYKDGNAFNDDKNEVIKLLQELKEENIELKETVKNLRWEGDEYDKKLNKIDFLAMQVEIWIKEIRSKI